MSDFILHNIKSVNKGSKNIEINNDGIYISILNATNTPPHLVMVVKGLAYSLSVSGFKTDRKLQDLIRLIWAKEIKSLFIELVSPRCLMEDCNAVINSLVSTCQSVKLGEVTCIYPIKEFCKVFYNLDISRVDFIFDLLPILERRSLIKSKQALHMNDDIISGAFSLRTYGMEEIHNMIEDINDRTHSLLKDKIK